MKNMLILLPLILVSCYGIPEETGTMEIYFCPRAGCEEGLIKHIEQATEVKCAFYDLDLENLSLKLKDKHAEVLVYEKNYAGFGTSIGSKGLMHNKFCILDKKEIVTGSFNPTNNGNDKNNNNMIIIESRTIAENYLDEFEEIKKGENKETKNKKLLFNGVLIENYFCPEDKCKEQIIEELSKAEKSIYFMAFSFTDKDIADILVEKSKDLVVKGVMEKKRINMQYNVFKYLNGTKVKVLPDTNPGTMHHKVFIIDNTTVITGSYNPTKSADEKNDENILIIHDIEVAEAYTGEFEYLLQNQTSKTANY